MVPDNLEKIRELAEEVSRREGCQLYDMEFSGSNRNRILRIFIDGTESVVTLDQCANVSRGLGLLLDVEDIVPGGRYELEVSSPGLERNLRLPWHFKNALGETVQVSTHAPVGSGDLRRTLKGELDEVGAEGISVVSENDRISVDFDNIKKAQVVFVVKKNLKKR